MAMNCDSAGLSILACVAGTACLCVVTVRVVDCVLNSSAQLQ